MEHLSELLIAILIGGLAYAIKRRFWPSREAVNTKKLGEIVARIENGEPSYSTLPDLMLLIENTDDPKKKKELLEIAEKLCENAAKLLTEGES